MGHYNHRLRCGKLSSMTILSIQSHVSFGHVGNAAGVFVLQRMGFDVWPVHTVLFSNQPGYGTFQGHLVEPGRIADIVSGIEERGVFEHCQAIIGGYLGSADTGKVLLDSVQRVKQANPESMFFCDPVMGDRDEGLYVTDDVVQFYTEQGGPAADILKPNAYELEILAGQTVCNPETAIGAATSLIERWNLRAVVVSSVPVPDPVSGPAREGASPQEGGSIACMVVTTDQAWSVETPLLPVNQKGAGDAFLALFVSNILLGENDFPAALSASASSIWSIMNEATGSEIQELQLIALQDNFSSPSRIFKAMALNPHIK